MALQGRNPKEALGNFLASIGDIQRQHEVYAMENQRELDRQAQLKSQLETDAIQRALLGTQNTNAQGGEKRAQELHPGAVAESNLRPDLVKGQISQADAERAAAAARRDREVAGLGWETEDRKPGGWIEKSRNSDLATGASQRAQAGAAAARSQAEINRLNQEKANEEYLKNKEYQDGYSFFDAIQMGERNLPGGIDRYSASLIQAALRGQEPDTVAAIMKQPWILAMLPPEIQKKITTAAATQEAVNPGGKAAPAAGYVKPKS
jgi:hypothetical protein